MINNKYDKNCKKCEGLGYYIKFGEVKQSLCTCGRGSFGDIVFERFKSKDLCPNSNNHPIDGYCSVCDETFIYNMPD